MAGRPASRNAGWLSCGRRPRPAVRNRRRGRARAQGGRMDADRARARLRAERAELTALLREAESAGEQDREAEGEVGDVGDSAQTLAAQGVDDAVAASL